MSYSIQRATSTGFLNSLALSIQFVDRDDIHVYVNDVLMSNVPGQTTHTWGWASDTVISITPNVPNGNVVLVRRITKKDKLYHNFNAGAVFRDKTVDENFLQVLYIAQEAIEGGTAADYYNDLDLHGYVIRNSGTATQTNDLVSFGQYRSDSLGAYANRLVTESARTEAVNASGASQAASNQSVAARDIAQAASVSSIAARDSAESAKTTAIAAKDTAVSAASTAEGHKNAAGVSANSANSSYLNSAASATLASKWADNNVDVAVTTGKYSAKHWATKAYDTVLGNTFLAKSDNLAALTNKATARSNLDIGTNAQARATFGFTNIVNHTVEETLGDGGSAVLHRRAATREIMTNRNAILGYGKVWEQTTPVAGSVFTDGSSSVRIVGTTYTNTLTRPIVITLVVLYNGTEQVYIESQYAAVGIGKFDTGVRATTTAIIAAGQTYVVNIGNNTLQAWYELR